MEHLPFFRKNLIQGEKLDESNFWETEPLPHIVLDSFKIDKETRITQSRNTKSDIGLIDMEILRMEKINKILSLWFILGKILKKVKIC